MRTFSLQSGSNGNCIYVESDGVGLLFDAGISGLQTQRRLANHDRDIRRVAGVILSHDHVDHVRCAGIYQRKFDVPIYATPPTFRRIGRGLGRVDDVRHFAPGDRLDFGPLTVQTLRTSHDAVDGAAFVVEADGKRLGILTDLGHPFAGLPELIGRLDAAYLESNYDASPLYAAVADRGGRLITPRRKPGRGLGHRHHHPHRLQAIAEFEHSPSYRQYHRRHRLRIEQAFAHLTNLPFGLAPLPNWVRRHPRVERWIAAKIVLYHLYLTLRLPTAKAA